MENYSVGIEVRTSDNKLIRNDKNNVCSYLDFDVIIAQGGEENFLNNFANKLKVWMPDNIITIELSVVNSISGTYMVMYSFYVNEKRFIKH